MSTPLIDAVSAAARELELRQAAAEQREIELTQRERYARRPLDWITDFVWTYSPFNPTGRLQPVRLAPFPGQVATVEAWIDLAHLERTGELVWQDVVAEKSRQIGETWAVAAVLAWALHLHRITGLAMHEKAAKIDDGGQRNTHESLFGKIRFIDRRLGSTNGLPADGVQRAAVPGAGQPLAFRPFSRDPAKVENLETGAVLLGEGQTDNPGRGSTLDCCVVDEAAHVQHGEKVHAAIDEACKRGKLYLSTPEGQGNMHARLAKERPQGWTYLRLHWSDHPHYRVGAHIAGADPDCQRCQATRDGIPWTPSEPRSHRYPGKITSPWYDERVVGKTDEQVANELDIDRERAKPHRVYPEWSSDRHVAADPIGYDPEFFHLLELALDPGLDVCSVLVFQDMPTELRMIGILEQGSVLGSSGVASNIADALTAYLAELGVPDEFLTFEWRRRIYGVADPAAHNRETATGKSYVQELRKKGFFFTKPPSRLTKTIAPSVSAAKRLLEGWPKPLRVCPDRCEAFVDHARENTWRVSPDGRVLGLNDDVHNHAMRALAYYAVAKFPPPEEQGPLPQPEWPGEEATGWRDHTALPSL